MLDVPPKLAARVRLLEAGDTNKDDPNDALSVAVAALRSKSRREVTAEDYAAVLKVWAKRHRDLSRACNQVACRLHAVLCGLVPGGFSKEITAGQAARVLEQITPSGAIAQGRYELASQFLDDLRNLDAQLLLTKKKLAAAVPREPDNRDGDLRRRPRHRRHRDRRHRQHLPLRHPRSLRRPQRHRPGRGVLRRADHLPALAARQPADQPCHSHGRHHPDPQPAQRRPRLLRPQGR